MPLIEGAGVSALERSLGQSSDIRERVRIAGDFAIGSLETDPDYALSLMERMAQESILAGCEMGRAWWLMVQGWIASEKDEIATAKKAFDEAVEILERSGDDYGLVKALNGLASVFKQLNLFDRALEVYRRAFTLAEALPNEPELVSIVCTNIGISLTELGDHAAAVRYLERAVDRGYSNLNNSAIAEATLALAYAETGRLDEAETMIVHAIHLCKEGKYHITATESLGRYGILLSKLGRIGEARTVLVEAAVLSRSLGCRRLEAEFRIEIGKLLSRLGRRRAAEREVRAAARVARTIQAEPVLAQALSSLAEIRAETGDWRAAYVLTREQRRLETKVFDMKVASQAAALKAERAEAEAEAYHDLYRRLSAISEIGQAVASALDVDEVGRVLYEKISSLMDADAFGVALYHEKRDELEYRYYIEDGVPMAPLSLPVDGETALSSWCLRHRKDIVMGDVEAEYRTYIPQRRKIGAPGAQPMRSLIYYPVMVKEKPVAVVTVQSRRAKAYEPHHVETLKALGAYMGIALENARLFEEVRSLAVTDPLTGILNRRRFVEIFAAEFERSRRYEGTLGVIIFDLDHFKNVNDRFGHATGDAALRTAVASCLAALRSADIMARYGGEEFVISLPETDLEGSMALAERLRSDLEAARVAAPNGEEVRLTASFGVAVADAGDGCPDAVIARADRALYAAKRGGRNCVACQN